MSNSIIITLIICITVIIVGIEECIYHYIIERDHYDHHKVEFEIDSIKHRLRRMEFKIDDENS